MESGELIVFLFLVSFDIKNIFKNIKLTTCILKFQLSLFFVFKAH